MPHIYASIYVHTIFLEIKAMKMGDFIREHRLLHGLTQEELGQMLSPKVNRQAVNNWERGRVDNIKRVHIGQLAQIFDVSPIDLMCLDVQILSEPVKIPLLGHVAAGVPIYADGNVIANVSVSGEMTRGKSLFALKVKGDSMSPLILDGDTVIVSEQPDAEDGQIVVATVNSDDGCVKRLKKYGNTVGLVSVNPAYDPMLFSQEDVENLPVCVVGRVIEIRHRV